MARSLGPTLPGSPGWSCARTRRSSTDSEMRLAPFAQLALLALLAPFAPFAPLDAEWPVNGGIDNIRYSPLTHIDRPNATRLKVAWTYDSKDAFKASQMQS